MRIGLFDPYLDTLGGGERYLLSIASSLLPKHSVSLFWNDHSIIDQAKNKFNISLDGLRVVNNIFSHDTGTVSRLYTSLSYDVIFYVSDGSIPSLLSRSVFPIVQYPIANLEEKTLISKIKLFNTKTILCYSLFIREFLLKQFNKPVRVLYPPVKKIPQRRTKEKIILSVGRFTRGKNTKKQEFLIDFFLSHKLHFRGWKLILIGSALEQDRDYVADLRKRADKSKDDIEIVLDASYAVLSGYYARARIYWHAAGVGEDLTIHPERAEHFGISVVEAMSAGCVPVVYAAGGPREIVDDDKNGFLFTDSNEFFHKTKSLMTDARIWQRLSETAIVRSDDFSPEKFTSQLKALL